MDSHSKQRIALRYWLLGAGFHTAAEAMTFAESYHTGVRRDGVTPEFAHQVAIASMVRTQLPHLRHPQEALSVSFLHDIREDYDLGDQEIRSRFGDLTADGVWAVTKTFRGVRRDDRQLFADLAENPTASVVKAFDRVHNLGTMNGVFTTEKMVAYIAETKELFFPMLKQARRNFPDQEPAYENAKLILASQVDLLSALVEAGVENVA